MFPGHWPDKTTALQATYIGALYVYTVRTFI